ncbi:hypothetical protein COI48_30540, partial [Bacillus thuringiensis]
TNWIIDIIFIFCIRRCNRKRINFFILIRSRTNDNNMTFFFGTYRRGSNRINFFTHSSATPLCLNIFFVDC